MLILSELWFRPKTAVFLGWVHVITPGELRYFNGTGPKMIFVFIVSWPSFGSLPKLYTHLAPRNAGFLKEFSKGVPGKIDDRMNSVRI